METCAVITHRLNFALRLVDTTNGRGIPGRAVEIFSGGKPLNGVEKPQGVLVFLNLDRSPLQLQIRAPDYEPMDLLVEPEKLATSLPMVELQLIPSPRYSAAPLLTVAGTLPGIEALSAVRCGDNHCLIREIDARRKVIQVFNPHHLELDRGHYGLVDPDREVFAPFHILGLADDQTLRVESVPEMEFRNYFPICPMVFGSVQPPGRYCLRVRDDAEQARWMLRYTVEGQARFQTMDTRQEGEVVLT